MRGASLVGDFSEWHDYPICHHLASLGFTLDLLKELEDLAEYEDEESYIPACLRFVRDVNEYWRLRYLSYKQLDWLKKIYSQLINGFESSYKEYCRPDYD